MGVAGPTPVAKRPPVSEIEARESMRPSAAKISQFGRPRCGVCGAEIQSRRVDARFCSPACRNRAWRRDKRDARKLAWSKPEIGELFGDSKRDRAKLYAATAERLPARTPF
jgi:hypothetical protein